MMMCRFWGPGGAGSLCSLESNGLREVLFCVQLRVPDSNRL
jgi:hypothetical protein